MDRSGEIGREGHEGAVAGGARADAVPVEPIGQAVVVDGLFGNSAGEQSSRSVWPVVDHEPGGWSIGQLSHDRAEAGRQKDWMLAGSQISVVNPVPQHVRRRGDGSAAAQINATSCIP
jgi:hypothetical protein